MKQKSKTIALILAVLLAAGTVTGCVEIAKVVGESLLIVGALYYTPIVAVEVADALWTADQRKKHEAAKERKITLNELRLGINQPNPFGNDVEERLTRRTSELTGGTPVDVTPYLLHEDSFAVINDSLEYCKNVIEFKESNDFSGFEYDIILKFEVYGKQYQENATVSSGMWNSNLDTKNHVKTHLKYYAAEKRGLNPSVMKSATDHIKNVNVEFINTRRGAVPCRVTNVFAEDTEPGYYQFDVDVEFQKGKKGKPDDFAAFTKVYRSDCQTVGGAALDVQTAIWKDACKNSALKKKTPLPRINFVRVAKFTE